jgi:hypothetical protein
MEILLGMLYPEDRGTTVLQNNGYYSHDDTMQGHRRHDSSTRYAMYV